MSDTPREQLAAYAHEAWAGWMEYLFKKSVPTADGSSIIPADLVARWMRQMRTSYAHLPPSEQDSDRVEADKMLTIVNVALTKVVARERIVVDANRRQQQSYRELEALYAAAVEDKQAARERAAQHCEAIADEHSTNEWGKRELTTAAKAIREDWDNEELPRRIAAMRAAEEAAEQRTLAAHNAIIAADALLDSIQRSQYMAAKLDLDIQAYREQASMYRALLMREKG